MQIKHIATVLDLIWVTVSLYLVGGLAPSLTHILMITDPSGWMAYLTLMVLFSTYTAWAVLTVRRLIEQHPITVSVG